MVRRVLFLCDRNAVRSPIAEALLRHQAIENVSSAGLNADDTIDPFAVAVMKEDGLDLSGHTPRTVDARTLDKDVLVVALSRDAYEAARVWRREKGFELDLWDLPAPPSLEGSRESILDGFRGIRDALKAHIANRFRV